MKCAIIYSNKDITKNQWFINKLITEFKLLNVNPVFINEDSDDFEAKIQGIDFAVYRGRKPENSKRLEKLKIRTFNSFNVYKVANNKYETFCYAKDNNIHVLKTYLNEPKDLNYPYVAKTVDGHGGKEVALIKNKRDFVNYKEMYKGRNVIFQEFASNPGVDIRVYVVGGKIYYSLLRIGKANDFRSNYNLGGSLKPYKLSKKVKETVNKISQLLNPDFIGVDFIMHKGKWILSEIEDPVGCRVFYCVSKKDIGKDFCSYCLEQLKK